MRKKKKRNKQTKKSNKNKHLKRGRETKSSAFVHQQIKNETLTAKQRRRFF